MTGYPAPPPPPGPMPMTPGASPKPSRVGHPGTPPPSTPGLTALPTGSMQAGRPAHGSESLVGFGSGGAMHPGVTGNGASGGSNPALGGGTPGGWVGASGARGAMPPPPPPRGLALRTPSGGGLPRPGTGTSATYAQAKHAQLTLKDLETARKLMVAEIESNGECAQSALKDLVCILKQMGLQAEATTTIMRYRNAWIDDDRMQESLDNMLLDLYKHSRNLEGQVAVTGQLIAYSQKALAEGRTGWMIRTAGCKNTVSVHRRLSTLYRLRGQAQMQSGLWHEAEQSLLKSLEHERLHVKEEDLSVNIDRAACLIATGHLVEAQDLLLHVAAAASLIIETPHKGVGGSNVGTVRRVGLALKALIELLDRYTGEVRKVADELERTVSVVNALDVSLLGEAAGDLAEGKRISDSSPSRRDSIPAEPLLGAASASAQSDRDEKEDSEPPCGEILEPESDPPLRAERDPSLGMSVVEDETTAEKTAEANDARIAASSKTSAVADVPSSSEDAKESTGEEKETDGEPVATMPSSGRLSTARLSAARLSSASAGGGPRTSTGGGGPRLSSGGRTRGGSGNGGTRGQRREGDSLWVEQVLNPAIQYFWRAGPTTRMDVLGQRAQMIQRRHAGATAAGPEASSAAASLPVTWPGVSSASSLQSAAAQPQDAQSQQAAAATRAAAFPTARSAFGDRSAAAEVVVAAATSAAAATGVTVDHNLGIIARTTPTPRGAAGEPVPSTKQAAQDIVKAVAAAAAAEAVKEGRGTVDVVALQAAITQQQRQQGDAAQAAAQAAAHHQQAADRAAAQARQMLNQQALTQQVQHQVMAQVMEKQHQVMAHAAEKQMQQQIQRQQIQHMQRKMQLQQLQPESVQAHAAASALVLGGRDPAAPFAAVPEMPVLVQAQQGQQGVSLSSESADMVASIQRQQQQQHAEMLRGRRSLKSTSVAGDPLHASSSSRSSLTPMSSTSSIPDPSAAAPPAFNSITPPAVDAAGAMTLQQQIAIAAEQQTKLQKRAQEQRKVKVAAARQAAEAGPRDGLLAPAPDPLEPLEVVKSELLLDDSPEVELGLGLGMEMQVQHQIAVVEGESEMPELPQAADDVSLKVPGDLGMPRVGSLTGNMFIAATPPEDGELTIPLNLLENLAPANSTVGAPGAAHKLFL